MTLAAGAIFGLLWGTVIVSFASRIGATLAFLASRFLLRDWVQAQIRRPAASRSTRASRGRARSTCSRCAWCRRFRSSSINLLMGLTPIRTWTFYWVSQLGMLAGTVVYVNAGTKLRRIAQASRAGLIGAFVLLGLFPLIAKRVIDAVKARRVYARWTAAGALRPQPGRHRRRLGGPGAGLHRRGGQGQGDAGRKAPDGRRLPEHRLRAVEGAAPLGQVLSIRRGRSQRLGIKTATVEFDFADVMERVQRVIRTIEPHDSVERYTGLGVECIQGEAKIVSPWAVEVTDADGTKQTPDHARHRHRRRRAAVRAADPRHRADGLPDLGHGLGPARAAARAWWCWAAGRSARS